MRAEDRLDLNVFGAERAGNPAIVIVALHLAKGEKQQEPQNRR